ncbi:MAG: DNA-processing protein DprA [Candidatus Moranbacteria bacterium]|nr:DNA-processing protein DprA [Candidatus Moranbacteria bacterium]
MKYHSTKKSMPDDDHVYAHAFLHLRHIGSETLKACITHFGDLKTAWLASATAIQAVTKIPQSKKDEIIAHRDNIDPEAAWQKLVAADIRLLTLHDETFPALLREIPDAPYTLYTKGNFDWGKAPAMVAVVGSRKFTAYGEQVATRLSTDLTQAGFLVVSGLAFGIDSIAHEAVLAAGGETIAVLGSGLHHISPSSHAPLAKKIMGQGAVISEYPPFMAGNSWTFPLRNRIIAGMTLGTIVIEAAERSGSLITASCALDYNREVFAVPGSILSPYSVGTNQLIKRGAKLVTGVQDILEEFSEHRLLQTPGKEAANQHIPGLSPEEQTLLSLLSHEPLHIDSIITRAKLSSATTGSLLTLLEIKGLAKNVGGMHYVRMQG